MLPRYSRTILTKNPIRQFAFEQMDNATFHIAFKNLAARLGSLCLDARLPAG